MSLNGQNYTRQEQINIQNLNNWLNCADVRWGQGTTAANVRAAKAKRAADWAYFVKHNG